MKKRYLFIIVLCVILDTTLLVNVIIPTYSKKKEEKIYAEELKNATIKVTLKDNLNVSFLSQVKVSDFIEELNGEITDDYEINTSTIGDKEVSFSYVNDEDLVIPYKFNINIVDDIAPVIWLGTSYTINTNYNGDLLEDITCADNYDDNPKCEIIGNYNTHKVGSYKLTFKATDASNNVTTKDFTLNVTKPSSSSGGGSSSSIPQTTFAEFIKNYKTDNTQIGIDVSSWQGNIDFTKVKEAGVEFVFIRVGSARGIKGEKFVDKQFINNIKGFNDVGIPVGLYYYSYADSEEQAIADANWVLDQIKGYKIDLPIAYDWESWSFYNSFHQSFYSLTKSAQAFLDTINEAGYDGLLYSSKKYLDDVWYDTGYPVWLAHYTSKTSYTGSYKYWQLSSTGLVPGIAGNVDINIMYK